MRLEPGDWLEFEVEAAGPMAALDGAGAEATVRVERSARGIRVTAQEATDLARLVPRSGGGTW